jgi:hypothetical protein
MFWLLVHDGFGKNRGKVHSQMTDDQILAAIWVMPHSCENDVLAAYPQGVTLSYLGTTLSLTRERIRQIQAVAIDKLKVKATMQKHSAYTQYKKDTYGLDSADPYVQSLPNMLGVGQDTRRRAGNGRWEKYHGDGRKPKVRE